MKNLVKILSSGLLVAGIASIATAQTFLAMRVNISGANTGTFLADAEVVDITATYHSEFPGGAGTFQNLVWGPFAPNVAGFGYIWQTGNLTFNLANFGFGLTFNPSTFPTTFRYEININEPSFATPQQFLTTFDFGQVGDFVIPTTSVNGQPAVVHMGFLHYDDTPAGGVPNVDPTPPNLGTNPPTPGNPVNGIPAPNGNGVDFGAPDGGTIGGMVNANGDPLGGMESMSVTAVGSQIMTSGLGNSVDVAMILDVSGCAAPPYIVTINIPQSVLQALSAAGATDVGIAHANVMFSVVNGNLSVLSGNLDGSDPNGAQVQFTLASCSPIFVQDANDDPLAIELVDFFASSVTSNSVTLNWATASETNNNGFIVERKAEEGSYIEIANWKTDEELVGAGNSSTDNEYSYTDRTVRANTNYVYRLSDVDIEGNVKVHNKTVEVKTSTQVDVIPNRYYLAQNHPNPFNPSTSINFDIKDEGKVTLEIYNVKGQLINTLVNSDFQAGSHNVVWNGTDDSNKAVSSGIYFYKISVNNFSEVKKMTFLK